MDQQVADLIAFAAIVTGLAVAYGKAFGGYQSVIVEWVIDAVAVPSRYRGLVNLAVGLVIALAFTALGSAALGDWSLMGIGALAGVFAAVEAARAHDAAKIVSPPPSI